MKHLHQLLLAAAAVLTTTLAVQAHDEPFLSPRVAQLRYELRKVPSTGTNPDLTKERPIGNAKAWSLAQDFRKVPSTGRDIDLAHAPRPSLSPKDPRYETVLWENAVKQLQIAPLK